MRVMRNTLFLYLSYFGGLILSFLQIKIISSFVLPVQLGTFFTITALGQIPAQVLLLGMPTIYMRYIPKFEAAEERDKISGLLGLSFLGYFGLAIIVYLLTYLLSGYIGYGIYHNELISQWLTLGVFTQLSVVFLSLNLSAFNGLRRMSYSALLNLAYLVLLTLLLYLFRHSLNVGSLLWLYFLSAGSILLLGFLKLRRLVGRFRLQFSLSRQLWPYWRYVIVLGIIPPLTLYLDRLLVGYFLDMAAVSLFVIALKPIVWARRILSIPLEALMPELSYRFEQRQDAVGENLWLVIKLLFLLALALATIFVIGAGKVILAISSVEYLKASVLLPVLALVLPLMAVSEPIATAMGAIGKPIFYVGSDLIRLVGYILFLLLLIRPLGLSGVAWAQVLSYGLVMLFNLGYVLPRYTHLKFESGFFIKSLGFGIGFGFLLWIFFPHFYLPLWLWVALLILLVAAGYLGFLKSGIISLRERRVLGEALGGRGRFARLARFVFDLGG
jgi:O-antigen/teichoic acid export membrane protein